MKPTRLFTIALAVALLLSTVIAFTSPTTAHLGEAGRQSSIAPLDTATTIPTTTPSACAGWSAQAPYPIAISNNAVASLGGYLYSFGGYTTNYTLTASAYKFDGSTWTAIASLPISITDASATTDGTYVYILSGNAISYSPNLFYRYDPASNTYTELARPIIGTQLQTLLYLNGNIYRLGMTMPNVTPFEITDIYLISINQWRTATNYPSSPAYWVSAVALGGYIYAAGGVSGPTTYRYDPTTSLWDSAAIADLQFDPNGATGGVLNGEWLLVSENPSPHPTYAWNPTANSWRRLADAPTPAHGTIGATLGDAFYTAGGLDSNNQQVSDVERFTNSCPTPTPTPTVTGTPPTATPSPTPPCDAWQEQPAYPLFVFLNAAVSLNGDLYSFGGEGNAGIIPYAYKYDGTYWAQLTNLPTPIEATSAVADGTYIYILNGHATSGISNNLYRYDPAADSYTQLAGAPISTTEQNAAYLNGKIYLVGGRTANGEYTSTVQIYNISTDSWSRAASYPQPMGDAAAVALNGYIYVAGGGLDTNKTYRYDPSSNTWSDSAVADAPDVIGMAASGIYNGEWLIAGGYPGNARAESWNPTTTSWRQLATMPAPREWLGGATLGSSFYAVGGEYSVIGLDSYNDNQRYTSTCAPAPPPPTATLCATPFGDISGDAFYGAIAYLYCRGAVSGTDANHYSPAATSTRSQFARVVVKGFGLPIVTPNGGGQSFSDVPPAYFAYNYVETGLAAGFLSGYTAAQCAAAGANYPCYLPNRPITRAELTKLVVKAAGYAPVTPSGGPTFVDVPASYFAYGYIETAYQHGIIRGIDASHFQPDRIIRRDEMAQIVYKGYITP